ncbi:MAG: urease accessory protein UreD [Minwuiales bacterium]|nr:urease accessory protein UreD [Minwuiales bacterium]
MSVAISLSDETPRVASDADLARADGEVGLRFVRDGKKTRLDGLSQRSPCRTILPNDGGPEPVGVLINTAGGVCGGDRLCAAVEVDKQASATVTGQAAEKIYRAIDRPARLKTSLTVGDGAALHWAPQETILFDGAKLRRRTTVALAPNARLLAAETLVFGRHAMGETLTAVDLCDEWRVSRNAALCWADLFRLRDTAPLQAPGGLAGRNALATLIAAGPDLEQRRDAVRDRLERCDIEAGATVVNGLLVVRLLGAARPVKNRLTTLLELLRQDLLGLRPTLPRVWHC